MKMIRFCWVGLVFISCTGNELENEQADLNLNTENEILQDTTADILWHYDNEFEQSQKVIYERWINEVKVACFNLLGKYPFQMNVHFHESTSREVPVSFGHTRRNEFNELHFYVNPTATYNELINDWTAQHEMSHLSIPFIGKENQWFSEGYATYLSRRIMIEMDLLDEATFDSLYLTKITEVKASYFNSSTDAFAEIAKNLFSQSIYGPVYWGGTSYFYEADRQLQEKHQLRLTDVIRKYQDCCRLKDKNLKEVVQSFDEIVGSPLFVKLCDNYENAPCDEVMKVFD